MSVKGLSRCLGLALAIASGPVLAQSVGQSSGQGWQGPFVGFHLGGASADFNNRLPVNPGPTGDDTSLVGGIQFGYNWQSGTTVYGAEADFSLMDIDGRVAGGSFNEDSMASLRLRAGRVMGETLVFGSLGLAWTEKQTTLNGVGSTTDYEPGVMLGGGAERFLYDNVTGRVEAYYVDVPKDSQTVGGTTTSGGSDNVIFRAGLNLHF